MFELGVYKLLPHFSELNFQISNYRCFGKSILVVL